MMMRPPVFICFRAACVATRTPRTFRLNIWSMSASVVSSKGLGMAVPALFTSTSIEPNVLTVFSTAFFTAPASLASA